MDLLRKISVILIAAALLQACSDEHHGPASQTEAQALGTSASKHKPEQTSHPTVTQSGQLTGTNWQLVRFQSMDDSTGEITVEDPSVYTMTLNEDGSVKMQLNCNQATGSWTFETANDGVSGKFSFGPMATTRALCPPPSIDERIAHDLQWIRSYLLRNGQLHLSLMADGGIYSWEPLK